MEGERGGRFEAPAFLTCILQRLLLHSSLLTRTSGVSEDTPSQVNDDLARKSLPFERRRNIENELSRSISDIQR
jgi:hypothetical protein